MSRVSRDYHRKKLNDLLSHADDEAFFQMVWAVDALQSGREQQAARYLRYPPAAVTDHVASEHAVHPWDLETLVGQLLITPKSPKLPGPNRMLNCTQFVTIASTVNRLRKLENSEAALYLPNIGIWVEMHRLGQRQFPWQRGFVDVVRLYRYAFIYGQGDCADYFLNSYGISVNDFSLVSFAFYAAFLEQPCLVSQYPLADLEVSETTRDTALALLSVPLSAAQKNARHLIEIASQKHSRTLPTAYLPSFLRRWPVVNFGGRLRAPLPELIILRGTAGVYYDVVSGEAGLRNEVVPVV